MSFDNNVPDSIFFLDMSPRFYRCGNLGTILDGFQLAFFFKFLVVFLQLLQREQQKSESSVL